MVKINFPIDISPQLFLTEYWQKNPLLIKHAFNPEVFTLSAEELAGLACENDIESRIVTSKHDKDWRLHHGPFDEAYFASLPDSRWTLLVQDADKHVEDVENLLAAFKFIPDWRIDDIMISYAVANGSVGPHTDAYDVFLIQTQGKRHWKINDHINPSAKHLTNTDLKILAEFNHTHDWILEPGDMLYLPPQLAHWGVALDECMTYSVGFRSATHYELCNDWCDTLIESIDSNTHYQDPLLEPQSHSAEITSTAISQVADVVNQLPNTSSETFSCWFGCFSTRPKPGLEIIPNETVLLNEQLLSILEQNNSLIKHPYCRFAFTHLTKTKQIALFYNGEQTLVPNNEAKLVVLICENKIINIEQVLSTESTIALTVLSELYNNGCFYFDD